MSKRGAEGIIFVVSGPSGSGKTTLTQELLKERRIKKLLYRPPSFTTRPRRSGERQGRDYFFVGKEEFLEKRKKKKFLEWIEYLGYYYATSKELIEKEVRRGANLIVCLDLRGAKRIKRLYPHNSVTIFIKPPSLKELRARIEKRCNRTHAQEIERRLLLAEKEILDYHIYDYSLVNKELKKAVGELKKIIENKIIN